MKAKIEQIYYCPTCQSKLSKNGSRYHKKLATIRNRYRCSNKECGKSYLSYFLDYAANSIKICMNCKQEYNPAHNFDQVKIN